MTILVGHMVDSALAPRDQAREALWKEQLRAEMTLLQPSVQELVWGWLLHQRSANTSAAYGRDLREWLAFCNDREVDPLTATRGQGDAYGRWLEQVRGLSGRSAARKLAASSSWYVYLAEEGVLEVNPFGRVRRPEISRRESSTVALTESEARAMVWAAANDHGRQKLRTAALIPFMIAVGPRVSETVSLAPASLGFEQGWRTVRIVGKGGKIRLRRVPEEASEAMDAYLAARLAGAALFTTASGGRMVRSEVSDLVKRVAGQAGLYKPERVTPHALRHTFATLAHARGATPREIQEALGHGSLDTTEIYLHAAQRLEDDPSAKVAKVLW